MNFLWSKFFILLIQITTEKDIQWSTCPLGVKVRRRYNKMIIFSISQILGIRGVEIEKKD